MNSLNLERLDKQKGEINMSFKDTNHQRTRQTSNKAYGKTIKSLLN